MKSCHAAVTHIQMLSVINSTGDIQEKPSNFTLHEKNQWYQQWSLCCRSADRRGRRSWRSSVRSLLAQVFSCTLTERGLIPANAFFCTFSRDGAGNCCHVITVFTSFHSLWQSEVMVEDYRASPSSRRLHSLSSVGNLMGTQADQSQLLRSLLWTALRLPGRQCRSVWSHVSTLTCDRGLGRRKHNRTASPSFIMLIHPDAMLS